MVMVMVVVVPVVSVTTALRLVSFRETTEGSERVRTELVEDSRDEFRKVFLFAVAVDDPGVGGGGGLDWVFSGYVGLGFCK